MDFFRRQSACASPVLRPSMSLLWLQSVWPGHKPCCNMGLPGGFAVSRNEFARRVTYVKIMYVHPQPFSRRKVHGIFSVFHWFHISICKMFA